MAIVHLSGHLILTDVRSTILDTDSDIDVVEMPPVQLKELYQHNAQVNIRICDILPGIQL